MKKFSTIRTIAILLAGSLLTSAIPLESVNDQRVHNYLASNLEYTKTLTGMKAFRTSKRPVVGVAAHRAANEFAPENTLAAMQIALELEVDYIEIDLRQTRDGRSLILHDGNLDRTTTGKGPLKEMSFEEARKLSAGSWFDPFFADEKILTLEESCRLISDHNKKGLHPTYFYVDCKDINVRVLIDTLSQYKLLEGSVFYVNEQQISQIRNLAPRAKLLPGLRTPKDLDRMIDTHHPYALDVNWKDLSKELIAKAHVKGVKIFSDGFGENQRIESYVKAIRAGIDVISTNKVSVICEAAKEI
jgi:glycerophosphoryl diester phosphodiesterase